MGDWGSIIVRFEVENSDYKKECTDYFSTKGLIVNHYKGFNPEGLVNRAAFGLNNLLDASTGIRSQFDPKYCMYAGYYWNAYQQLRRSFDFDLVEKYLTVSHDGVESFKKENEAKQLSEMKDAGNEDLFWCDADFGVVIIDLKADCATQKFDARYAFMNHDVYDDAVSIDEYVKEHKIGNIPTNEPWWDDHVKKCIERSNNTITEQDMIDEYKKRADEIQEGIDFIKETAVLMTKKEKEAFLKGSNFEYIYYNEIINKGQS